MFCCSAAGRVQAPGRHLAVDGRERVHALASDPRRGDHRVEVEALRPSALAALPTAVPGEVLEDHIHQTVSGIYSFKSHVC